jgi:hypothetical protein
MKLKDYPHSNAMVISANIVGWTVTKILVDTGSSADILFASTFDRMKLDRSILQPAGNPLFGFGGQKVMAIEKVTLPVTFEEGDNIHTENITFDVVDTFYNYNAIFGRGIINTCGAAIHSGYLCMKVPSPGGVIAVFGDQDLARAAEGSVAPGQRNVHVLEEPSPEAERAPGVAPVEETKTVPISLLHPEKRATISALLDAETEAELVQFLTQNNDIFAWSVEDLQGIDRSLIEHHLNVKPEVRPVKQKLRKMSEERAQAALAEVNRLLDAEVIRPVQYPT